MTEQRNPTAQEYASLVTASLETSSGPISIAATAMRNEAHIVKVNDYWMDITPSTPYLLFVDNLDQPGTIGAVGTVAGRHNINISFMEVGRLTLPRHGDDGAGIGRPGPSRGAGGDKGPAPDKQRPAGEAVG